MSVFLNFLTMKRTNLFSQFILITLLLINSSCKNEPDNVAISSDGVNISFDNQGAGEPTLVFIHGWTNNKTIWDAQMSLFSKKYNVVAVDLAGSGLSGNNRDQWTIPAFSEDVVAVINKLDLDKIVLVGFSMGAPVAMETAKKDPNKVIGIVIVDSFHNVEMKYTPEIIHYMDSIFMGVATDPTMEKLQSFFRNNKEASFERILSMLNDSDRTGWRESLHNAFRWENDELIPSLDQIKAPIIAINSDQQPTNIETFKKYVPSFKAHIIPDVGHLVMWDAPEEFNRLLEESINDFLKDQN